MPGLLPEARFGYPTRVVFRLRKRLSQTRFSFGTTSAVMTNLGLVCGLDSGSSPKRAIIGSILVIAFADNISDSFGIHVFQESECLSESEVWTSTLTNFFSRVLVSLSFVLIVAALPLAWAVPCAVVWGLAILALMSWSIARDRKDSPAAVIGEHLVIALAVIAASKVVGRAVLERL
jgi:VIT1/CCC1 family predicted Fe2+/Mn2+ transporter